MFFVLFSCHFFRFAESLKLIYFAFRYCAGLIPVSLRKVRLKCSGLLSPTISLKIREGSW